jgi:hypothetical protein
MPTVKVMSLSFQRFLAYMTKTAEKRSEKYSNNLSMVLITAAIPSGHQRLIERLDIA